MEYIRRNKGVIIFYLLLVVITVTVVNYNERRLSIEKEFVYLHR